MASHSLRATVRERRKLGSGFTVQPFRMKLIASAKSLGHQRTKLHNRPNCCCCAVPAHCTYHSALAKRRKKNSPKPPRRSACRSQCLSNCAEAKLWGLRAAGLGACGFSDQIHLTRVFTGMVGVGPGAWRRALDQYVPTLMIQRTQDTVVNIEGGGQLPKNIPNARFLELSGTNHLPFLGDDIDQTTDDIAEFLTDVKPARGQALARASRCPQFDIPSRTRTVPGSRG
jgi:pimeloyl-ACP methyl ester carboxylesterase